MSNSTEALQEDKEYTDEERLDFLGTLHVYRSGWWGSVHTINITLELPYPCSSFRRVIDALIDEQKKGG